LLCARCHPALVQPAHLRGREAARGRGTAARSFPARSTGSRPNQVFASWNSWLFMIWHGRNAPRILVATKWSCADSLLEVHHSVVEVKVGGARPEVEVGDSPVGQGIDHARHQRGHTMLVSIRALVADIERVSRAWVEMEKKHACKGDVICGCEPKPYSFRPPLHQIADFFRSVSRQGVVAFVGLRERLQEIRQSFDPMFSNNHSLAPVRSNVGTASALEQLIVTFRSLCLGQRDDEVHPSMHQREPATM